MSEAMTSTERVLAVLRRQEPDRIPTFEWEIDPDLIVSMTGGGSYEDFIERFDLDAVMSNHGTLRCSMPSANMASIL